MLLYTKIYVYQRVVVKRDFDRIIIEDKIKDGKAKKAFTLFSVFREEFSVKIIGVYAGSATFFFLMSFFPILILFCSILPFTHLSEEQLILFLNSIVPSNAATFAEYVVNEAYEKSFSAISISALAAIWMGAIGMMSIIRGVNWMYGIREKRNYFLVRGIACLYTIGMLIIILIMFVFLVYGENIVRRVLSQYPHLFPVTDLLMSIRYIFVITVSSMIFMLMYAFIPNEKLRIWSQFPGAIFTTLGWTLFSKAFGIYTQTEGAYSLYGGLATFVIIMFWLYACIYILFVGAFINDFLRKLGIRFRNRKKNRTDLSDEEKEIVL